MVKEQLELYELQIPEHAYVGRVEKEFYHFYKSKEYHQPIIIDLSDVAYIQITTLIYLTQFIYKRDLTSHKTYLRLPKNDEVRIILFTWRFFEIIEQLTGKNIFQFIEGNLNKFPPAKFVIEDKTFYLDISKDYFDKFYKEEQIKSLVKKGFFSFICEPFKEENQKYLALKKQRRTWSTEKLITDVLQKNLLENIEIGNLLANTIIFECLTNAANHPKSDHLVIGSFYDYSSDKVTVNKEERNSYFTIVLWDDGDSIIKTLSESLNTGINIRSDDSFEVAKKSKLKFWFRIIRKGYHSDSRHNSLFYDYLPTRDSFSDEILLSSFLPGISRKPNPKKENVVNSDGEMDSSSGSGLGLTFLLKAVVKDLNGTIHIRSDDYLLEITKARTAGKLEHNDMLFFKNISPDEGRDVDFHCKSELKYYPTTGGPFMGNMITIKIPLKKGI